MTHRSGRIVVGPVKSDNGALQWTHRGGTGEVRRRLGNTRTTQKRCFLQCHPHCLISTKLPHLLFWTDTQTHTQLKRLVTLDLWSSVKTTFIKNNGMRNQQISFHLFLDSFRKNLR